MANIRKMMDTSIEVEELEVSKMQKMEEEEVAPRWALELIKETRDLKLEVRGQIERFEALSNKVVELENKVGEGSSRMDILENEMAALRNDNETPRGTVKELRGDLDGQIDRGLRDHINFFGLSELKPEKTWQDSIDRLAGWLSKCLGKPVSYFDDAIIRCHRGPYDPNRTGPRPIFTQIKFRVAEEIRNELKFKSVNGVMLKDHFSANTQNRVNQALMYRKEWRRDNAGGKAYIQFPATLKTKKAGDERYSVEKIF